MGGDPNRPCEAVVIGCSAGGTQALCALLPALPADFPLPVMVVLHLAADAGPEHLELFQAASTLPVVEPQDKQPVAGGMVYLAPPGYHLMVEMERSFALSNDEPVHCSRPAIDVLFETASEAWGDRLCGVLLTGASRDGSEGLFRIGGRGGFCVVEDPRTAEFSMMPGYALERCEPDRVLSLEAIGPAIAALRAGPPVEAKP